MSASVDEDAKVRPSFDMKYVISRKVKALIILASPIFGQILLILVGKLASSDDIPVGGDLLLVFDTLDPENM